MPDMLSIGDFARATHLNVKTLRYYQEAGLLLPAEIDPHSGYRRGLGTVQEVAAHPPQRRKARLPRELHEVRGTVHFGPSRFLRSGRPLDGQQA